MNKYRHLVSYNNVPLTSCQEWQKRSWSLSSSEKSTKSWCKVNLIARSLARCFLQELGWRCWTLFHLCLR